MIRQARELAAQAWCKETTKNKVMDPVLCEAFTEILEVDRDKFITLIDEIIDEVEYISPSMLDKINKLKEDVGVR